MRRSPFRHWLSHARGIICRPSSRADLHGRTIAATAAGRLIVAMGALSHNIDVRGEAIRAADGHEPTQADLDRIRAGLGSDH
jgi:hypothetical protein